VNDKAPVVFLIDDDLSVLKSVTRLLSAAGFETRPYSAPKCFLDNYDAGLPGCIVMDLAMPEISGLDLQKRLASSGYAKPIIFITGQGDIPTSVRAMKAGAVDFLTKPFNRDGLLSAVRVAIGKDRAARRSWNELDRIEKCRATLTSREREVFELVTNGRLNKQIAGDLGIAEKTVKIHRGRMMRKMEARTLADLVQLANRLKIAGEDPKHEHSEPGSRPPTGQQ
jgi:FixJ family two-component response regulator